MILYRNTKVKVRSPGGDTDYFDIVAGVLQGDTLSPYFFIICLDYMHRTSIDKIKENSFKLTKKRSRRYPAKAITDTDYTDDIVLLANAPAQVETLLHSLEWATAGIGLHVNAHKMKYMCFNQTGDSSTQNGSSLKLVDKFTYLGSSVSSTKTNINTRLAKAWKAINRLSVIWKSDLTDKMKRMGKKLDSNYTIMLWAILDKSWRQHPTKCCTATYHPSRKLSKLDEPDMWDTAGKVRTNSEGIYSCGPLHMAKQRQDDQLEPTSKYSYQIFIIC